MLGSMLERLGIVATASIEFLAPFPFAGVLTLVVLELVRRRAHRNRTT